MIVVGPKADWDAETARAQPRAAVLPVAAGEDPNAADTYQRVLRLVESVTSMRYRMRRRPVIPPRVLCRCSTSRASIPTKRAVRRRARR